MTFAEETLEQVREMTDLHAEIAISDPDYCKLLIGDFTIIEANFGKMPTLSVDGWEGATWTFGTVADAADAAEVIEYAHGKLGCLARGSVCAKMQRDTVAAFTTNILGVL